MTMILEAGQICPYGNVCPYNNNSVMSGPCYGTVGSRESRFICDFVVNGKIVEGNGVRLPEDKTGRMKIITE
jgi:hypothetical protein